MRTTSKQVMGFLSTAPFFNENTIPIYRIAGKFGGDFNLADWRIDNKPPNLNPPTYNPPVSIDVRPWPSAKFKTAKSSLTSFFT